MIEDRNWGPAIGYYELARIISPSSGASYNQLAVIALADNNHLRAVYYLYRALAVEEPHPSAKGNLEIEFKKIQEAQIEDDKPNSDRVHDSQTSDEILMNVFMGLHARYYNALNVAEYEADESEVMRHLAVELKEQALEDILNKLVLINISAEYFAGVRLKGK